MEKGKISEEIREHIPFTATASLLAVIFVLFLKNQKFDELFHVFHPLHLFASSIVSAGIFYKYKKNFLYAVLIGAIGSIIIGSLSDIIFPYFGGILLNLNTSFHLPLIEEPALILSSALLGSIFGAATKFTKLPHFIHVFVSVFASLFYLLAFSSEITLIGFIGVFFVVFVAVLIPCCISDIVFPLLFARRRN